METRNTTAFSMSRNAFQATLHLLGADGSRYLPGPVYSADRVRICFLPAEMSFAK